jgi:hypothetical protein
VFADGTAITGEQRHRYRSQPQAVDDCPDPFAVTRSEFDALFPATP